MTCKSTLLGKQEISFYNVGVRCIINLILTNFKLRSKDELNYKKELQLS